MSLSGRLRSFRTQFLSLCSPIVVIFRCISSALLDRLLHVAMGELDAKGRMWFLPSVGVRDVSLRA